MIEVIQGLWESQFVRLLLGLLLGSIMYDALVGRKRR